MTVSMRGITEIVTSEYEKLDLIPIREFLGDRETMENVNKLLYLVYESSRVKEFWERNRDIWDSLIDIFVEILVVEQEKRTEFYPLINWMTEAQAIIVGNRITYVY